MMHGVEATSSKPTVTPWAIFRVVLRLIVPVAALLLVYVAAYFNLSNMITRFDVFPDSKWYLNPGYWLTVGHFILPLAFFVSILTNRRYGDGYALAQLIVTWAIIGGLIYALLQMADGLMSASPLPSQRVSLAFLFAIIMGQIVGIYVFDQTRGRTWWGAPMFAALWGQTIFVMLFYTLAYVGISDPWVNFMMMDLAIKVVASFLMLIPYGLLRGLIRPLPGYGGA